MRFLPASPHGLMVETNQMGEWTTGQIPDSKIQYPASVTHPASAPPHHTYCAGNFHGSR